MERHACPHPPGPAVLIHQSRLQPRLRIVAPVARSRACWSPRPPSARRLWARSGALTEPSHHERPPVDAGAGAVRRSAIELVHHGRAGLARSPEPGPRGHAPAHLEPSRQRLNRRCAGLGTGGADRPSLEVAWEEGPPTSELGARLVIDGFDVGSLRHPAIAERVTAGRGGWPDLGAGSADRPSDAPRWLWSGSRRWPLRCGGRAGLPAAGSPAGGPGPGRQHRWSAGAPPFALVRVGVAPALRPCAPARRRFDRWAPGPDCSADGAREAPQSPWSGSRSGAGAGRRACLLAAGSPAGVPVPGRRRRHDGSRRRWRRTFLGGLTVGRHRGWRPPGAPGAARIGIRGEEAPTLAGRLRRRADEAGTPARAPHCPQLRSSAGTSLPCPAPGDSSGRPTLRRLRRAEAPMTVLRRRMCQLRQPVSEAPDVARAPKCGHRCHRRRSGRARRWGSRRSTSASRVRRGSGPRSTGSAGCAPPQMPLTGRARSVPRGTRAGRPQVEGSTWNIGGGPCVSVPEGAGCVGDRSVR